MAVSNAQQPGNAHQSGDEYVADQDVQARKRTAIGLSPHRETARSAVQRPPDAGSRFPQWLLVACLMLLAAAVGILLAARTMDPTATWAELANWGRGGSTAGQPPVDALPDYLLAIPGYELWMTDDFTQVNANVAVSDASGQVKAAVLPAIGIYEMTVAPGQIGWTLFDVAQLPGYWFETSATVDETTPLGAAGIVGRFASAGNFYLFSVDGSGAASVQVWKDGQLFPMLPPTVLPVINRAGKPNRLSLQDADGKMSFFVNQNLLFEVVAPQLPSGRAGMAAISGGDMATVDFDWVAIYAKE